MTDMQSDPFDAWRTRYTPIIDDSTIYAGRNPTKLPSADEADDNTSIWFVGYGGDHTIRPTRWQRAKWIAHDDIVAAREYVADLLWNLSEWIRP
jgi:hypothetical protein